MLLSIMGDEFQNRSRGKWIGLPAVRWIPLLVCFYLFGIVNIHIPTFKSKCWGQGSVGGQSSGAFVEGQSLNSETSGPVVTLVFNTVAGAMGQALLWGPQKLGTSTAWVFLVADRPPCCSLIWAHFVFKLQHGK